MIMTVVMVTVMKVNMSFCHHGGGSLRAGDGGEEESGDNDGADDSDHVMLMALLVT